MHVHSFPPVSDESSRLLILGSMPGKASLLAAQYYAHPRNSFWKIMGALLELDPAAPYEQRLAALRREGIAVWDVLKSCTREGSLDSDIEESSIVVNRFGEFLRLHARIRSICFNGAKAAELYRRHVIPELSEAGAVAYQRLPSTSPAHAGMSYARKVEAWRVAMRASPARLNRSRPPAR